MSKSSMMMLCYVAVAGLVAAPQGAKAADARIAAFKAANATIQDALSRPGAKAPLMSDATYARRVAQAFDVQVVELFRDQPLPQVLDLCSTATRTQTAYMLVESAGGGAGPAQAMQSANRNYLRFQDEMAIAGRFGLSCMALEARKIMVFVKQLKPGEMTPVRRNGLLSVQSGVVRVVSGTALSQIDPIRPANRKILIDALVDNIDPLVAAMSKDSRERVIVAIDGVQASRELGREARPKLSAIRKALSQAECEGLCALR